MRQNYVMWFIFRNFRIDWFPGFEKAGRETLTTVEGLVDGYYSSPFLNRDLQ